MNKIIQIRGSNAVGKTTCLRQFIQGKNLHIEQIKVDGINTDITTDERKTIVILGRYDVLNGGCDRFRNRKHVVNTILFVIKQFKPKTIIFEGFIYGKTFKMAQDIDKLAKMFGYMYQGIMLYRTPEKALQMLYNRNGEANINEKVFFQCYKSSLSSYKKIKEAGINIIRYNTDNIDISKMGKIIEENL